MQSSCAFVILLALSACAAPAVEPQAPPTAPATGRTVVKVVHAPTRTSMSRAWQAGEATPVSIHSGKNPRFVASDVSVSTSMRGNGMQLWLGEDGADEISIAVDSRTSEDGVTYVLVTLEPEASDVSRDEAFSTMEWEEAQRRRAKLDRWLDPFGSGRVATAGGR